MRKWVFIGVVYILTVLLLGLLWYSGQYSGKFTIFNDANEWAYLDKIGHSWSTYLITNILLIYAVGTPFQCAFAAFLMVSSIEVADGFSTAYGLSVFDLIANLSGAILAIWLPWGATSFRFKFSFFPSEWAPLRPELLGSSWYDTWLKDYNGQTYWLTYPIFHKLWPQKAPKWLAISIGYSADGMLYGQTVMNTMLSYEFFIAPDILLSAFRPQNRYLQFLFYFLDSVKWLLGVIVWNSVRGWYIHCCGG